MILRTANSSPAAIWYARSNAALAASMSRARSVRPITWSASNATLAAQPFRPAASACASDLCASSLAFSRSPVSIAQCAAAASTWLASAWSPTSSAMARAAARCSAASPGLSSDMVLAALILISASRRGSTPADCSLAIRSAATGASLM